MYREGIFCSWFCPLFRQYLLTYDDVVVPNGCRLRGGNVLILVLSNTSSGFTELECGCFHGMYGEGTFCSWFCLILRHFFSSWFFADDSRCICFINQRPHHHHPIPICWVPLSFTTSISLSISIRQHNYTVPAGNMAMAFPRTF